MNPLFRILACLAVVVAGCSTDTKPIAPSSEPAAKIATDDSSTPATTPPSTSAVTPDSVWASLKAQSKYTSAGSSLAAFILAAGAGDLAAVTSFVQAGDTPLHAAVASGNLLMVRDLVGQGASVDAKNTASETPLHYAAAYGHLTIVKYLEGQGADLTITSSDGLTPTQTADLSGQTAVNTYLAPKTAAEARAELTRLGIAYTDAAFIDSAGAGNLAVVKLFVQAGMSVDVTRRYSSDRPLYRAAEGGHLEVVKYLVGQGADVDAIESNLVNFGLTALHWAAHGGHLSVVRYLVGQGSPVNSVYATGTPLTWAVGGGWGGSFGGCEVSRGSGGKPHGYGQRWQDASGLGGEERSYGGGGLF